MRSSSRRSSRSRHGEQELSPEARAEIEFGGAIAEALADLTGWPAYYDEFLGKVVGEYGDQWMVQFSVVGRRWQGTEIDFDSQDAGTVTVVGISSATTDVVKIARALFAAMKSVRGHGRFPRR